MNYGRDIERILISEAEIAKRVAELGEQISRDYAGRDIMLIAVLKGAYMFTADLIRKIEGDVSVDFISIRSYNGTTTSGEVHLLQDLKAPVYGKNILLVEDIIDSGITLSYLKNMLLARKPGSFKIACLLDKADRRQVPQVIDYAGFTIPNEFVVGYGMDYNEKYRNLPDICVLAPSEYQGDKA
ncbi:MAG TPA: hypoxanthine phosphoribosyltransferase [Eubacteriales bacterium]|jgi:hypoxanthine phosphoribosyltransferase|nr:hypoxanthine phosphoribosyltransferase [Clostridia bacterium]HRR89610.1 hypoxanthine phosphoribosyltransferase [Eubacteriales bacterium]HRU83800.1 hypoxanthine phosphoribosyltransferase [Eubacteriales bacterium]